MAEGSELTWDDGETPRSRRFDDFYYQPGDGVAESRFNFIAGCGLPDGWSRQPGFVIGETGFGTGLNFLVTLAAWRAARPAGHRLHYVSAEGWPLTREELARAHRAFPELRGESATLLDAYPDRPPPGFQRFHFDADGVVLDLLVGEVGAVLSELEGRVDAWFLDGFAPDRNPDMWRDDVLAEVARLSDIGTRLATFTAAGRVRRGLEHAGFAVHRVAGFGQKRERIVARFDGPTRASALPPWAQLVVAGGVPMIRGRGIAGGAVARALDRRGLPFAVAEPRGATASTVPHALVMPRLTVDESIPGRFFATAFAYARRWYRELGCWHGTGSLQLARDEHDRARFEAIGARWDLARLDAADATALAGVPVSSPALHVPDAGFVLPGDLLAALPAGSVEVGPDEVTPGGPVVWAAGSGIADGPLAAFLPLAGYRGQVSLIRSRGVLAGQRAAVIAGNYLSPPVDGRHMIGSTFDPVASSTGAAPVRPEDHERNVAAVADALSLDPRILTVVDGWAGIRAALPDRLPAVGPAPEAELFRTHFAGLRTGADLTPLADPVCRHVTVAGLGARGFTVAPLAAELLVSQWLGEPWPVPRSIALALSPVRFLVRALRRRKA